MAITKDGKLRCSNGRHEEALILPKPKSIDLQKVRSAEIVWAYNQYWLHLAVEKPKVEKVKKRSSMYTALRWQSSWIC